MRIVFAILIVLHGLIHIMGFAKAFGLAEISALKVKIKRHWGLLWAAVAALLVATAILYIVRAGSWWVWALVGAFLSQGLILRYWSAAKYGTVINILIFVVAGSHYLRYDFLAVSDAEINRISASQVIADSLAIDTSKIDSLPDVVANWMRVSGVPGQRPLRRVESEQQYALKLTTDQEEWHEGTARQVSWTAQPAFVWDIDLTMMPMVFVAGRDVFEKGVGRMEMKAMGLFAVVDLAGNSKINQAALQRYLAEIVWYPSFALSEFVEWTADSSNVATAIMDYEGTTGSCTFHFGPSGLPETVTAMRFRGGEEDAILAEWHVALSDYQRIEGYLIPRKAELSWKLDDGLWTWARLEVTEYSVDHKP